MKANPSVSANWEILQWIRNLWLILILGMPAGKAAVWDEWRICSWISQVPLLFLHFLVCDSDSHLDVLVKSFIGTVQGCATDTSGVLHICEKFVLNQRAGRDAHKRLKTGELRWWTGGTGTVPVRRPGLHQHCKKTLRPHLLIKFCIRICIAGTRTAVSPLRGSAWDWWITLHQRMPGLSV